MAFVDPKYQHPEFPVEIKDVGYGYGLVLTKDVPKGTIVCIVEGPRLTLDQVPAEEYLYFILDSEFSGILPKSEGKYLNHGCYPTCCLNNNWQVETIRDVKKGEIVNFRFNEAKNDADLKCFWDPKWSFECKCGHPKCKGQIDRYVYYND